MADTVVEFNAPLLRSTLEKIRVRATEAMLAALQGEAATLLADANSRVPEASGELAGSAFIDVGLTAGGAPAATVGYEAPYAGAVHEGFHGGKQSDTPHRFWLQQAANAFGPGFLARFASVARSAVGR